MKNINQIGMTMNLKLAFNMNKNSTIQTTKHAIKPNDTKNIVKLHLWALLNVLSMDELIVIIFKKPLLYNL